MVVSYGGITRIRFTGYNLSPVHTVRHPFRRTNVHKNREMVSISSKNRVRTAFLFGRSDINLFTIAAIF